MKLSTRLSFFSILAAASFISAIPASAQVYVSSPSNGAQVGTSFTLAANANSCSGQGISAMGFSFDNSADNTIIYNSSINTQAQTSYGSHTLHVKAWGNQGASCDTDISLDVTSGASGGVEVDSPSNGAQVGTSFTLTAEAPNCSGQTTTAMGYSFDNSPNTTIINSSSINTSVQGSAGNHTLHVKAWGNQGASCDTDVSIDVTGSSSSSSGPYIPSNAASVSNIQMLGNWQSEQDSAVGGWASGWTNLVGSPSGDGTTVRQLATTYSGYGNYRYDVAFGDDTSAQNFVYDGWVYLTSSTSSTSNIEMDMNQTMPNGQTAIFGFQCDGWSNTWDYTVNAGSPTSPVDQWWHSGAYCNIQNWGQNQWHHVQVSYSRDDSGNITYQSVWLDGNQQQINATVNSAFALGWSPVLLTNFQVDELYSGGSNATIYLGNLTISRW